MTRIGTVGLVAALWLAQGCPSAYQRTYDAETRRLETQKQAADERERADHAAASRFAAVVYFQTGSAVVDADGQRELRWFLQKIQPYPKAVILLQGFADTTGSEATNRDLSQRRVQAVAAFLESQGIDRSRLSTQGFGTESPAATNATPKGRSRNRRVEVTVL